MKAALLIATARRVARAGVRSAAALQVAGVAMHGGRVAGLAAAQPTPLVASSAIQMRAFSKKPRVSGDGSDSDSDNDNDSDSDSDGDSEDASDSDDEVDSDDEGDDSDEDAEEEEEDDFEAYQAAKRAAFNDEDLSRFESADDDWDEERWGKLDSEDWQGFDGDLDAVTEEGVPKWLQSVRDLSAIHQEKRMRDKLARRAMEEAKMNVLRVRKVDDLGRAYGTGRRKTSTARVWIKRSDTPFDGRIKINKKDLVDYFVRDAHREDVLKPFVVVNEIGNFDVYATVAGGGLSGQAGAIRHGISRALQNFDPALRPLLKKEKLLTRDPRMVERKKPGQKKARKKFQWVKR